MGARALNGAWLKGSFHDGLFKGRALKGGGILSTPPTPVKSRTNPVRGENKIEEQDIFLFFSSGLKPGKQCLKSRFIVTCLLVSQCPVDS